MADRKKFTRKEIEHRNQRTDAVFVIDNVVYNVTEFLDDHPGGVDILLDNAGKDASKCFKEVGHSDDARDWMRQFIIGEVVDEDKWEIKRDAHLDSSDSGDTIYGLIVAWTPPIAMAIVALIFYKYFFD